jgi:uncharacterized protein (TIGR02453 family)
MAKQKSEAPPLAPFNGFGTRALSFFDGLAANQTREWFLARKQVYQQDIQGPLGALVEALTFAFAAHDIPLTGDARRSLFRIHRDVRFSKDKSPYKTNAGAVMTRDGTKDAAGLLYIQVGSDAGSMVAAGFYGPPPNDLATLRRAIADDPERWEALGGELGEAGLTLSMGSALSRIPRGFEAHAQSPVAEALKRRNLVVSRPIPPERLGDADLVDDIVDFTASALPLLRFGWRALDRERARP